MNSQPSTEQRSSVPGGAALAPPSPTPDPGASPLSADAVQRLVDQAAHFNLFSLPDRSVASPAIAAPGDARSVIGWKIHEVLHRFDIISQAPTAQRPLRARNRVGEPVARFTHRWLLTPDDFVATPDREPPPTPLDPSRSQRFVMLDGTCTFGSGEDGFRGFGAGHTVPVTVNGQPQLLATCVGTVLEGSGKFRGHEEGTYLYCGSLAPQRGFQGNLLLRLVDRQETFRADAPLPSLEPRRDPEPGITYLMFRGQAVPSDPVTPQMGPGGRPTGLTVVQGLRLLDLDCKARGRGGVQSTARVGAPIGSITAHVNFNPAAPGGTALDPIPFTTYDELVFFDKEGKKIGGFTGDSSEGRVFNTQLSGLPGIRFGGVGQALSGTGPFEGINGLMTDNSLVVFNPHVSASIYLLRVEDPHGRFRAAISRG
ncbi:MAG TPA: hypothetical protein VF173_21805 [Thermoanaerobaculia bacterium]|nr:hypothetical protein [Thermoanaerobaculia bacterium]